MEKIVYSGFDTLDLAIKGAFSTEIIDYLEETRKEAEISEKEFPIKLGKNNLNFLIMPYGQRGGFKFVITDGPTGAIYAIKANSNLDDWNLFISVRSNRLLTHGYEKTKAWIFQQLFKMEFRIVDYSINRIDFAIDIQTNNFELDFNKLITPSRAKVSSYWTEENTIGELKNHKTSIVRGGRFESITVGKMPNRQVIVYDKRRAAIDQKHPWWFDAWGVDREDPAIQVWRIEIRAGRDALAKRVLKRTFESCEAELPNFLREALEEVRYVEQKNSTNVTRSKIHPFWKVAQEHASKILDRKEAPILPDHVLKLMREQRRDMAIAQCFGNLLNAAILDGISTNEIVSEFPSLVSKYSQLYTENLGDVALAKKASEIDKRLKFLRET